jgi:two-component system, response regulator PhcR
MSFKQYSTNTILFVDDDPLLAELFLKIFEIDFNVVCVNSVDEAIALIESLKYNISVVVTDFKMPSRDGLNLLHHLSNHFPKIIKILMTAHLEKDLALKIINQQLAFRIIEKPFDLKIMKEALIEAIDLYLEQKIIAETIENGIKGIRESLGFIAHELNSPLSIMGAYLGILKDNMASSEKKSVDMLSEVQTNIHFCQNIVNSFSNSAKQSHVTSEHRPANSFSLITLLINEFPFQGNEKTFINTDLTADFLLPQMHNLIYLCLSTVLKNALRELAHNRIHQPRIVISSGEQSTEEIQTVSCNKYWIAIADNGLGIESALFQQLLHQPTTSYKDQGGSGMGLMFCKKVMLSLGGNISLETWHADHGYPSGLTGTRVTLHFPLEHS